MPRKETGLRNEGEAVHLQPGLWENGLSEAHVTDRYGRTVAWVFVDGLNLNEEIVRAGFAWHYKKYSNDENLARAENEARVSKAGLWSEPNAIPPWEFRRLGKRHK